MRTSSLFGAKIPDFSKFMVCPHGQGELSRAEILRTRRRKSILSRFCADVLYGCPLRERSNIIWRFWV